MSWFTEVERRIYTDERGIKWDPLHVRNELMIESAGALWAINDKRHKLAQVLNYPPDVTTQGMAEYEHAQCLKDLCRISRSVFDLHRDDWTDAEAIAALDRFVDWLDRKKAEARPAALLASVYQVGSGLGRMTYEQAVGLEPNVNDMELRKAYFTFIGVSYAIEQRPVPLEWFIAVFGDTEIARKMFYETNKTRE